MLTKFAVKNYRGFADRIEWELSHPGKYDFNTYAIKDDVIKNGIIYGPNGCGKSNFALALFDIENHLSQKWKKQDYYFNYVYAGKPKLEDKFLSCYIDDKPVAFHPIISTGTKSLELLFFWIKKIDKASPFQTLI